MRLTKIYTRTGDDGSTGLGSGRRVAKDDPQVEAYGEVDEVNASIGVALAQGLVAPVDEILRRIQHELFDLGGDLSLIGEEKEGRSFKSAIDASMVDRLEADCDALNRDLAPLENFILPGGSPGAAALHHARCICRRAERRLTTLAGLLDVPHEHLRYINRLSDLLFILCRFENETRGISDPLWRSKKDRGETGRG